VIGLDLCFAEPAGVPLGKADPSSPLLGSIEEDGDNDGLENGVAVELDFAAAAAAATDFLQL
jgi:hypothetical protein